METKEYFDLFEKQVREVYEVANQARVKGLDPASKVEIPLARSLAEKVVGLFFGLYPQLEGAGVEKRILELEEKWGKMDTAVAFKIAEEVAKQKFCQFSNLLEAIDAGIRIGFAYITLGVVSSPIEGYTHLKLGKRKDNGKEYFIAYFSGPIRSAGTTASCVVLMLIDYLRELFGFARYDPTEEEVKRYYVENVDYHMKVTNLQYMPTEEEILLAKNLPIQVAGDPTEKKEVSNYKNLERVETNNIRGGMCLIFSEGLAQKAKKGLRLLNKVKEKGFKSTGWDHLSEYVELHEKREKGKSDDSPTYINDLVAGRPIFGHPARSGAFRFRYGRGRNNGFSATSVHPATMAITDGFLATGTQLKIEKPTKGTAITSCTSVDGPIVKLVNGSVRKLDDEVEAKRLYPDVQEIIYLGDILFPLSDVVNRNSNLIKPGYVEEWWKLDLLKKDKSNKLNEFEVDFNSAIEMSNKYNIPLHPNYIYYWTQITSPQFESLIEWLKYSRISEKIIFPFNTSEQERFSEGKRALELLGIEHEVTIENVVLNKKDSKAFLLNLGLDPLLAEEENLLMKEKISNVKYDSSLQVLDIINSLSKYKIKDKAGEFIGARMGRPEKAKLRKLTGSPNVLFPVGNQGGRLRSVYEACNVGKVWGVFQTFTAIIVKKDTIYPSCEVCGEKCVKKYYCPSCKLKSDEKCEEHEVGLPYSNYELDINYYMEKAKEKLGYIKDDLPPLIKGVRGLSSESKITENLAKGILRARHNLQVNKDGTIRFDATELPILSFKPKEIFVSIDKLKSIGYTRDIYGKELVDEEQILELKPHDIILPSSPESQNEKADDVFVNVANFVDDLLEKMYGLPRFYNLKNKEDLVGQLGVCMAPHNCAGVVCRFIGFSDTLGLYASPYMHAAIRRDCDGDEAAVMLLGDVLLNFSKSFLPEHRGGTQDAPLVLNAKIDAGEVDDQILDLEFVDHYYPIELYELAELKKHSSEVDVETVEVRMKEKKDTFVNFGFTHDTDNFNRGVVCSTYKTLPTMSEKVGHQMALVEKIRAADTSDTARLIIEKHFIRDLRGNLRGFSQQDFRCVGCNEILRRPPLKGICPKCGGKLIFTIHEGGIRKYLEPALNLADKYHLSTYLVQHIELTKRQIDSVFGKDPEKQEQLSQWF